MFLPCMLTHKVKTFVATKLYSFSLKMFAIVVKDVSGDLHSFVLCDGPFSKLRSCLLCVQTKP